jgi:hypothetical protein
MQAILVSSGPSRSRRRYRPSCRRGTVEPESISTVDSRRDHLGLFSVIDVDGRAEVFRRAAVLRLHPGDERDAVQEIAAEAGGA